MSGTVEIVLFALAVLVILGLGRLGMHFGAFYEVTSTLMLLLAMLVSLRYWYPMMRWVASWWSTEEPAYATFGAYWVLFLLGCVPLLVVMSRITQESVPKYPAVVDAVIGLVFGTISATILVCCVMTSLSVLMPKLWDGYNREALPLPLDTVPIRVYEKLERDWVHIPASDPGHTRFPTFEKADVDNVDKYWK
jgi:hypothetical protein